MSIIITHLGITFKEQFGTGTSSVGSEVSGQKRYIVQIPGGGGETQTIANVFANWVETVLNSDPGRWNINCDRLANDWFLLTAGAKTAKTTWKSFSTSGGSLRLMQSYQTRASYAAAGAGTPPNYQGAIGVSDSGVAGVDVQIPAFSFAIRRRFKFVSDEYLANVTALTGRVCSVAFKNHAAGEVLFLGADGAEDDSNYVDISYQFAARKNETLSIGGITGINKRGWDYLWVRYQEKFVDNLVLQVPQFVYVERVFPEGDLNTLGV